MLVLVGHGWENLFYIGDFSDFHMEHELFCLIFYAFNFCQKSIEDKLSNLSKEKEAIKKEIGRINPELQKVKLTITLFSHNGVLVGLSGYFVFMLCS